MTYTDDNISLKSGKHLTYAERNKIEAYLEQNLSYREIGRRLGHHHSTISKEVKHGTVRQIKQRQIAPSGKVYEYTCEKYSAEAGQYRYDMARSKCGRLPKWLDLAEFMNWADEQMLDHHWSPESVIGHAKQHDLFPDSDLPCVTTLYTWIDRGIMQTKNIDLLEKTSRRTTNNKRTPQKSSTLGTSIDERPQEVETRETFGHWEIDTVIGAKDATDDVLLTLVERQSRFEYLVRIPNKSAKAVQCALIQLMEQLGEEANHLFKSITSDNGTEFTGLEEILPPYVDVYYCHPYSSWERGTSENQHKLIRRFIPKGQRIDSLSDTQIRRIQQWMNDYPRKQHHFATAHDLFAKAYARERRSA